MGVLPSLLSLLLVAVAGVRGHAAVAPEAEEAMVPRYISAVLPSAILDRFSRSAAGGQVQAGTLCCSNMEGYHECVEACWAYYPREKAAEICDTGCQEAYQCVTVSGDECPSGHRSSDLLTDSAKANAIDYYYCVSGCKSSVCSKMVTGVSSEGVKHTVERCNNACRKFCTKGVRAGTSAA